MNASPDAKRAARSPSVFDRSLYARYADRTDRTVEEVEAEFHRKHQYMQYLEQEGMNDFTELFGFLSNFQTNEAATVERAKREKV